MKRGWRVQWSVYLVLLGKEKEREPFIYYVYAACPNPNDTL